MPPGGKDRVTNFSPSSGVEERASDAAAPPPLRALARAVVFALLNGAAIAAYQAVVQLDEGAPWMILAWALRGGALGLVVFATSLVELSAAARRRRAVDVAAFLAIPALALGGALVADVQSNYAYDAIYFRSFTEAFDRVSREIGGMPSHAGYWLRVTSVVAAPFMAAALARRGHSNLVVRSVVNVGLALLIAAPGLRFHHATGSRTAWVVAALLISAVLEPVSCVLADRLAARARRAD